MHSIPPLRQTYTVVSPFLSSSDNIHHSDQKEASPSQDSQPQSSKPNPRTIPRHSFLIRIIVFVLLEFGFIALVSAALSKPIILHISFTITEVKGAVTAISILWHTLAVYAVKDILLNIFSAEWVEQDDKPQNLTLQDLDIVSRLTTGFIDQAKHFVSKQASQRFRLGFLSLLLLILLKVLGPSAIGVNLVSYDYPCTIPVANISCSPSGFRRAAHRANLITQLEMIENVTTSGYQALARQPNVLIPWPGSDSIAENTTVTYQSDVIQYNFSCSWNTPSMSSSIAGLWVVAGSDSGWILYPFPPGLQKPDIWSDPTIYPLMQANVTSGQFNVIGTSSLTSFIFVGGNLTWSTRMNLEDIPSLSLPSCNTTGNPCPPFLVSFLICDPQLQVLPATINATLSSLEVTILPGVPTVNNISAQAANAIFSSSLFEIASEGPVAGPVNDISNRLFLHPLPSNPQIEEQPIRPLPLEEINQNMNNVLASSAKAYLGGYNADEYDPSFDFVNTSGITETQKMALVGSKPFLVASSVVVGLLVILLSVLVAITKADQLESFELENIVKRLLNYDQSSNRDEVY